jgi:hypothetical protein
MTFGVNLWPLRNLALHQFCLNRMAEEAIFTAGAAVYKFDGRSWSAADGGASTLYVYYNPQRVSYRILALDLTTNQVKIRMPA